MEPNLPTECVLARDTRSAYKVFQTETEESTMSRHMCVPRKKRSHLPRATRQVKSICQTILLDLIIAEVSRVQQTLITHTRHDCDPLVNEPPNVQTAVLLVCLRSKLVCTGEDRCRKVTNGLYQKGTYCHARSISRVGTQNEQPS